MRWQIGTLIIASSKGIIATAVIIDCTETMYEVAITRHNKDFGVENEKVWLTHRVVDEWRDYGYKFTT